MPGRDSEPMPAVLVVFDADEWRDPGDVQFPPHSWDWRAECRWVAAQSAWLRDHPVQEAAVLLSGSLPIWRTARETAPG